MWPKYLFPFTMHFKSIKPVLSDHLSYVSIFHCCLRRSHMTGLTVQLTLVISNSMGPCKKFESTVVRLKRSYEDTGSVVCLTTKGRQLERNFEELKPASHVPILGTILNIFDVFVAVFFSPLNSLNLVKRLITSRYVFLCEWICLSVLFMFFSCCIVIKLHPSWRIFLCAILFIYNKWCVFIIQ